MRNFTIHLQARRNRGILIAVALTTCCWVAFTLARPNVILQRPCQTNTIYYSPSRTAATVMHGDLYCVVDPTCVSWIDRNSRDTYWHGLAMMGDPLLAGASPTALLAPANFGLLILISLDLIFLSVLALPRPGGRGQPLQWWQPGTYWRSLVGLKPFGASRARTQADRYFSIH